MTPDQLRTEVIRPVLKRMGLWSAASEELLLGTAIHESGGLKRITQYENGPAKSYFQMEPDTLNDLYDNFLNYRPEKKSLLDQFKILALNSTENLTLNLAYAVAAARLQYFRVPEALPSTLMGQANYWKKYWNTIEGKGTPEQYMTDYKHYIRNI